MAELRCHVCGCTEMDACPGGCSWANSALDKPLCSTCRHAAETLAQWMELCRSIKLAPLMREAKAIYEGEPVLATKRRRR